MNIEDFVTYKQALALKKLGFKERCLCFYADGELLPASQTINKDELIEEITISVDTLLELPKANDVHDGLLETALCDAPTLWEAQKWFRNKKKIFVDILSNHPASESWCAIINDLNNHNNDGNIGSYDSYEEALSAGITEYLKLLDSEANATT